MPRSPAWRAPRRQVRQQNALLRLLIGALLLGLLALAALTPDWAGAAVLAQLHEPG